jgi:hypothetical protein
MAVRAASQMKTSRIAYSISHGFSVTAGLFTGRGGTGQIPAMSTSDATFAELPPTLKAERHGAIAVLTLNRAKKRNALDDPTVQGIETFFSSVPDDIRAVVLNGDGDHFSAGPRSQRACRARHLCRRRAFALLASRLRADRIWLRAGGRRAARRGGRRRA